MSKLKMTLIGIGLLAGYVGAIAIAAVPAPEGCKPNGRGVVELTAPTWTPECREAMRD